jgi:hypothetical protein
MKLTLEINMDNAAFDEDGYFVEAARILREAADRLEIGNDSGYLRDINGNRVGQFGIED